MTRVIVKVDADNTEIFHNANYSIDNSNRLSIIDTNDKEIAVFLFWRYVRKME